MFCKSFFYNKNYYIFSRIHYPLPLPYVGKPDPRQLQEQVRNLREEIKNLKLQVSAGFNVFVTCDSFSDNRLCSLDEPMSPVF